MATTTDRPKKLQRISQACDLCHRRSIRCRPSVENAQKQCQNCYDFQVDCTYNRPSRRRRNNSINDKSPPNLLPSQKIVLPDSTRVEQPLSAASGSDGNYGKGSPDYHTGAYRTIREGRPEDLLSVAWRSFALASPETINRCLEIYLDVVYPMFPLFHVPTLWRRLRSYEHLDDRGFFASVMAACALAAGRARDGATDGRYHHGHDGLERQSEIFFSAAQDAIPKDLSKAQGLSYLRACGLLAVTALQYGQIKTMHEYMGHYLTLCAMQRFHDESRWPADITMVEKEERRRLFWSMYTFDMYTAVVFDGPIRSQETHANVAYPSEVDDQDLVVSGMPSPTDERNWLRGWNFTVDLYRILEHTVERFRRNRQRREDRTAVVKLLIADGIDQTQVMENVLGLYYDLPAHFKHYDIPLTGDRNRDIFQFQAANIQATLQLVRITVFSNGNLANDVRQKCDVAEQVLSTFQQICPQFLRAISTPMVYHLGAIGNILASAMEGTLTEDSYGRVRRLLVEMADLLQGLESSLQPTAGASNGLREHVNKIDQFMQAQRHLIASLPAPDETMTGAGNPSLAPNAYANHNGRPSLMTPLDEFQLPPDIVGEWPWPFDYTQDTGQPMFARFDRFD